MIIHTHLSTRTHSFHHTLQTLLSTPHFHTLPKPHIIHYSNTFNNQTASIQQIFTTTPPFHQTTTVQTHPQSHSQLQSLNSPQINPILTNKHKLRADRSSFQHHTTFNDWSILHEYMRPHGIFLFNVSMQNRIIINYYCTTKHTQIYQNSIECITESINWLLNTFETNSIHNMHRNLSLIKTESCDECCRNWDWIVVWMKKKCLKDSVWFNQSNWINTQIHTIMKL